MEFALVLLPLLAFVTVVMDVGWAIFAKSTLQRAVRVGVTNGITMTSGQLAQGACLTDSVKSIVQSNALGLLSGNSGLSAIKVNYYSPPAPNSNAPMTDATSSTDGNSPGNIMQVSVQNFSLVPLLPRIVSWNSAPDNTPLSLSVYSAGMIEPSQNLPCKGTAP